MRNKISTIAELQKVPCKDNGEPLVNVAEVCCRIRSEYRRTDSGLQDVLVRKSVADKLQTAFQAARVQKSPKALFFSFCLCSL